MKFEEFLLENINPCWNEQYIKYGELKILLRDLEKEKPSDINTSNAVSHHYKQFDEMFFFLCENELKKINLFYSEKLAEAYRRFAELIMKLNLIIKDNDNIKLVNQQYSKGKKKTNNLHDDNHMMKKNISKLQLRFYDFYLELISMENYQILNFLGFQQILQKYDKLLFMDIGTLWFKERILPSNFHMNKETKQLIHETEVTISKKIEEGDLQKTIKRLRSHPAQDCHPIKTIYRVGLYTGCLLILLIAAFITAMFYNGGEDWHIVLRIYRGPLVLIELVLFAGINIHIWQKAGINHICIFGLDPKDHLNKYDVYEIAALLGIVWTMSVLGFLYSSYLNIPPYVFPLAMLVLVLAILLNPLPFFWYKARFGMLKIMGRTLISPTFQVYFSDYWLADQMISLWLGFMDLHFYFCFYLTRGSWFQAGDTSQCLEKSYIGRSVSASIPAAIRFLQCLRLYRDTKLPFPHLANAGKYGTVLFVFTFMALFKITEGQYSSDLKNPYFKTWIFFSVLNAVWAFLWDVIVDWGLFSKLTGKNKFLKDEMIFPYKSYYYLAIIEDFILRYNWLMIYLMTKYGFASLDLMFTILSPLEVFRRFLWNIFRLENEHIRNRDKYQSVRCLSLCSYDDSSQKVNLRTSEEKPSNCRRRKSAKTDDSSNKSNEEALSSTKIGSKQILSLRWMKGSYKPGEKYRRYSEPQEVFVVSPWPEYK